jgi:glycosyltransferase involved in cell wall biosynthesis
VSALSATPFSLLMAIYSGDRADFFEEAFTSTVVDQQVRPSEVVLVQDGPISAELVASVAHTIASSPIPVNLVVVEKNAGLAAALTTGLEHCAFDVVARMDADDISMPDRFAKQLPLIDKGYDLVGTGMYEFEAEGILGTRIPPTGAAIAGYAAFHDPFNHPTVVYRRSAVLAAGAYQDLPLMEDYWLFVRMINTGARVENIPEPLLKYRVDSGAYNRRGGSALFRSELTLQRAMRSAGYTTRAQYLRNLAVRGGYRFVPVPIRRVAYRLLIARGVRRKRGA